jgi:uncharacterized protein DUF6152
MKTILSVLVLAGLCALATPSFAHHGYAAYDMLTTKVVTGTITTFIMANPHSQINMDVKDPVTGAVDHWVVEDAATVRGMRAGGFTEDTLKAGDEVTVDYHPAKGSVHAGLLIHIKLPDGRVLPRSQPGASEQAAPAN